MGTIHVVTVEKWWPEQQWMGPSPDELQLCVFTSCLYEMGNKLRGSEFLLDLSLITLRYVGFKL